LKQSILFITFTFVISFVNIDNYQGIATGLWYGPFDRLLHQSRSEIIVMIMFIPFHS